MRVRRSPVTALLLAAACGRSVLTVATGGGGDDDPSDATSSSTSGSPPASTTQPPSTTADATSVPPNPTTITTDTVTDSASFTDDGPPLFDMSTPCGDGTLDPGEACDDGNDRNDDACTTQCTLPFEDGWSITHDGDAHGIDEANDVVVDGAGNLYVVGEEASVGAGRDLWVQQYGPDGSEGWTVRIDGQGGQDDIGFAIAQTGDGDLVVAGSTESDATGADIFVARIDAMSQAIEWSSTVDGPGSGANDYDDLDEAADIIALPGGDLLVAGRVRVGALDWDVWIRRYDAAGSEQWTWTYDGPVSGQDSSRALLPTEEGGFRVLAQSEVENDVVVGVVLDLDALGTFTGLDELDIEAGDLASLPGGNTVVVGQAQARGANTLNFEILRFDADFDEVWRVTQDGSSNDDWSEGVAHAGERIYVVGRGGHDGQQENARLLVFDTEGNPRWGDEHDGPAHLADAFLAAALTPDGDVVVVGYEAVLGEQHNALVRKYHPLE